MDDWEIYIILSSRPTNGNWVWTAQYYINETWRWSWADRPLPLHRRAHEPTRYKNWWCSTIKVGAVVCDCKYHHQRVVELNGDDAILEDGMHVSLFSCCSPVDHEWEHGDSLPEDISLTREEAAN